MWPSNDVVADVCRVLVYHMMYACKQYCALPWRLAARCPRVVVQYSDMESLKDASKPPYPQATGGTHSAAVRFDRQAVAERVRASVGARTQRIIVTEMLVFSGIHGISMFAVLVQRNRRLQRVPCLLSRQSLAATVVICALLHLGAAVPFKVWTSFLADWSSRSFKHAQLLFTPNVSLPAIPAAELASLS